MANTAPRLLIAPSLTKAENTVNASPVIIDADFDFTDPDNNFNGGTLVVSGLLAEDSVAIRNRGTGAGEIGVAAGTVSYGGVAIGTVTGGTAGTNLSVTFNASATSEAIQALFDNLTYANSSDTPTATRTLKFTVTDAAGAATLDFAHPTFAEATGAGNPFNGIDVGDFSYPDLADLDGDGDLDAVTGELNGTIRYYKNTGSATAPVYVEQTGAANPFNGIDVGNGSYPRLADVDGDGDLDAVVGEADGIINYFKNTGSATAPVYTQQIGAANPFNVVSGSHSTSALADLDDDGDLDILVGSSSGTFSYYQNTGSATAPVYVLQTGAANPFDGVDVGDGSAPALADIDGDGDLDVITGEFFGGFKYFENTGDATTPIFVQRTGAANPFTGIPAPSLSRATFADVDGDGDLDVVAGASDGLLRTYITTLGVGVPLEFNVTAENDPPKLSGVAPSVTFGENTVNSTPQLLDTSVTFADPENNFDGGTLKVSGLLAEDSVAIRNQGTGAGQIGFAAGTVSYGGIAIGTVTGGTSGTDLSVTFNASATSAAIEALVENLTYANSSNTPSASRTLTISVNDGNGSVFVQASSSANPFNGFHTGGAGKPVLADIDGDGDLDAVAGNLQGNVKYYENTGTATAPVYIEQTGAANPFAVVALGDQSRSSPALADVDGDGDLDVVVGEQAGDLKYYENTGSASAPVYVEKTAAENPFDGINVGFLSTPALGDIDGGGDLDLVIGNSDGTIKYFRNTGSSTAPNYVEQTGADNPFVFGGGSALALADIDGDYDLDAVVGLGFGTIHTFLNFATGAKVTVNVTPENDAPTLNNNTGLTMAEGGTSVITASKLGYSDVEQTDAQLVYTIVTQTAGTVLKNGAPLSIASTFTQADIDGGLIEFRHDGSEGASAGFSFSLSDGTASVISDFAITVTPVDDAPTAVTLSNTVSTIAENTPVLAPLKVADIGITDIDGGANTLSLSGADAALFEIVAGSLFLKAGTQLDFETKKTYAVSVDVNDANIATTPDATQNFTLSVTDVNEAPTAVNFSNVLASIAENSSTAARIKVADIGITDDALGSETITLAGADAAKFEVINGVLYIKAGTVLNFEADSSLDVTVNVDDPTVGGAIDVSRALSVAVTDVAETINGTAAADVLNGGVGADRIFGLGGNDTINGGAGNDSIVGGAGADRLTGGAGADTFIFSSIAQSAYKVSGTAVEGGPLIDAGSSLRDVITDFTVGVDKIDVSLIDANENVAGNQAFAFRGTGNFAGTGSIVYRKFDNAGTANDHTVVYFDTTGDGRSDMLIALNGLKTLTAADFIL